MTWAPRIFTPEEQAKLADLWFDMSVSQREMLIRIGVSYDRAMDEAKALGLGKWPVRPPPRHNLRWTDEAAAPLLALWDQGLSASQIGKQIGETRSTVIGVIHRKRGAHAGGSRLNPHNRKAPAMKKPARVRIGLTQTFKTDEPADLPAFEPEIVPATAKPWLQREAGECNWPFGDGAGTFSCCRPVVGRGWCVEHLKRGTLPPPAKTRTPNQLARSLRRHVA